MGVGAAGAVSFVKNANAKSHSNLKKHIVSKAIQNIQKHTVLEDTFSINFPVRPLVF